MGHQQGPTLRWQGLFVGRRGETGTVGHWNDSTNQAEVAIWGSFFCNTEGLEATPMAALLYISG